MTQFLQMCEFAKFRKYRHILLALFWMLGFLCGVFFWYSSFRFLKMPVIFPYHLSIVELILSSLIPLLFFSFAAYTSQPFLLCCFIFCHATVVSFVFCYLSFSFADASWLFGFLYCFHSLMLLPILFWYTMRIFTEKPTFFWFIFSFVAIVCVLTAVFEYKWVLPLVGDMFEYWKG